MAPKRYLGAEIKIFTDKEGMDCYAISSDEYVANAVKEVEKHLEKKSLKLRGRANRPFDANYKPEIDITPELNDEETTFIPRVYGYIPMDDRAGSD